MTTAWARGVGTGRAVRSGAVGALCAVVMSACAGPAADPDPLLERAAPEQLTGLEPSDVFESAGQPDSGEHTREQDHLGSREQPTLPAPLPPVGQHDRETAAQDPLDHAAIDFVWPAAIREAVPFHLVATVPPAHHRTLREALRTWAPIPSLGTAEAPAVVPPYQPLGCGPAQLTTNAIHWQEIDGPGEIVAVTVRCLRQSQKEIVSSQIVLDAAEAWGHTTSALAGGAYDLIGVLNHELTHASGWDGHHLDGYPHCEIPIPRAVMCPWLPTGSIAWRTFTEHDIEKLQKAYEPR